MPRGLPKVREEVQLAAQQLTSKQKGLVDNMLIPGTTQEAAAVQAGYAPKNAHVQASRTLRLSHVQAYIKAIVSEGIQTHSLGALAQVARLSTNAKSEYVRLQAGQDILDRAGHKPEERSPIQVGALVMNIDLT
jgi:phage terminase small subunit